MFGKKGQINNKHNLRKQIWEEDQYLTFKDLKYFYLAYASSFEYNLNEQTPLEILFKKVFAEAKNVVFPEKLAFICQFRKKKLIHSLALQKQLPVENAVDISSYFKTNEIGLYRAALSVFFHKLNQGIPIQIAQGLLIMKNTDLQEYDLLPQEDCELIIRENNFGV